MISYQNSDGIESHIIGLLVEIKKDDFLSELRRDRIPYYWFVGRDKKR